MKNVTQLILSAALFLPSLAMAVGPWEVFETSFESSKDYDNPFVEVEVDVLFTDGKQEWKVPAFWDGEKTWKVRFSAPAKGTYTYRAVATDKSNAGSSGFRPATI